MSFYLYSDAESEAKKNEWREIAKKELEDWYKHREEQLEKTFKLNRYVLVIWMLILPL